ncbi:hypothetical protein SUGI_0464350 [Cryptomeria japonica]|nr:hypothetical protein SUGI_0464350 [Cryptomeria japonica]
MLLPLQLRVPSWLRPLQWAVRDRLALPWMLLFSPRQQLWQLGFLVLGMQRWPREAFLLVLSRCSSDDLVIEVVSLSRVLSQ